MDLKEKNILFFTRTMNLGGTENVILQLCEILKPYTNKIIVCSCGGLNVKKLEKMGIKHYTIPDIDNKSPKTLFKVFRIVYKIIKEEKISIVHTHHRMATFYMHLLKKICKVTLISTLHGSFSDKKLLTNIIYKNVKIIACGYTVKDFFVNNYKIDEKNITVINNAIKKEKYNKTSINLDEFEIESYKKIAYIGRLSKEKGVDLLIEAMPIILKNIQNICLIIVGEGPLEGELKNKVKELNIEKKVFFLGYQSEIQSIIQQIDLIVLPSYTEGLPLTPIEAFANGKPVVATAAGGTIEIIENNVNGFLVPIGDVKTLTKKIQEIMQNDKLYDSMCIEAKRSYKNKYDFDVFKDKVLDFYKKVVDEEYEK